MPSKHLYRINEKANAKKKKTKNRNADADQIKCEKGIFRGSNFQSNSNSDEIILATSIAGMYVHFNTRLDFILNFNDTFRAKTTFKN